MAQLRRPDSCGTQHASGRARWVVYIPFRRSAPAPGIAPRAMLHGPSNQFLCAQLTGNYLRKGYAIRPPLP
jgi:hypothetical protein